LRALKDRLPVSFLLFTSRGRINRRTYFTAFVFIWCSFYVLSSLSNRLLPGWQNWPLFALLGWSLYATAAKRLHDTNRSAAWLCWLLLPLAGPLLLLFILFFRKGRLVNNGYGSAPGAAPDYFRNPVPAAIPHLSGQQRIVDDVTQLNPVIVAQVLTPSTVEELQQMVRDCEGTISVGGGRFSMGGQTASPGCTHIAMSALNRVVDFSAEKKTICVEAGIRWCDIQAHIDPYNLSIRIMQTYANFTVGGALSVNCHGRYIGLGPLILSVQSVDCILANGDLVTATPHNNAAIFYGSIGCYNAISIIARVRLSLEDNIAVARTHTKMTIESYFDFFKKEVRDNKDVTFHNGDIYPPDYKRVRAVSWIKTDQKPTVATRLMPLAAAYPVERYFIGAFARSKFGKWRREFIVDPFVFARKKIHWRNYEAGYDVRELEPSSRAKYTYVLQEYFVPVIKFDVFSSRMGEIFRFYDVNVINVSIRHAMPDPGSLLAWAREEVFAFVVWYRQGTDEAEKGKVAVWTRALIDAAIEQGGAYYLPYQPHATEEQFHQAYPNAGKLFALKKQLDPGSKFSNVLWDKYFKNKLA
jgi:FAD/FMN-containing dehydrogenase/uncharacterized membrane protein YhaH (DUF805 family)